MGISIWQLLIVLVIVLLLFGTKRLANFGGDIGAAIKGFKRAVKDESEEQNAAAGPRAQVRDQTTATDDVIEGEARREEQKR